MLLVLVRIGEESGALAFCRVQQDLLDLMLGEGLARALSCKKLLLPQAAKPPLKSANETLERVAPARRRTPKASTGFKSFLATLATALIPRLFRDLNQKPQNAT